MKLPDHEISHIKRSLRLRKGDQVILFNGEAEFIAELYLVTDDVVMANIVNTRDMDTSHELFKQIGLFAGLIKLNNFELILEKATELGVSAIYPLSTDYSQIKTNIAQAKFTRWQKIILQACKQSERSSIPTLEEPVALTAIQNALKSYDLTLLLTLPRQASDTTISTLQELTTYIQQAQSIAIIIGPEGGFSPEEHELMGKQGVKFVTLGNQILKTETAAIAALANLNFLIQN